MKVHEVYERISKKLNELELRFDRFEAKLNEQAERLKK